MACPVCGNSSPCAHELERPAILVGPEVRDSAENSSQRSIMSGNKGDIVTHLDGSPWRDEVISRVQQHRARRRRRGDANASLEFDFPGDLNSPGLIALEYETAPSRPARAEPKIIEFPRPSPPPVFFEHSRLREPEDLELAGPVLDTPRILDAPEPPAEQMDLLPTFADIQLEPDERRLLADELPPQPAPLAYRIFAGLIDMIVVLIACAIFAMTFIGYAKGLPQPRLTLLYGLMVCGSLWLIYQYLFLVYSSGTPGMHLAQLELCTFKGEPVSLPLRRWRALANMLSAFALGLGFAWSFVDEDTLGWHDRMTQTHVRKAAIGN